jgi:WD40 repeat protein
MKRMSSSYRAVSNVRRGLRVYALDNKLCVRFAGGKGAGDKWRLDMTLRQDLDKIEIRGQEWRFLSFLSPMAPSRGPQPLPRTLHKTLANHKGPIHVARYSKGTATYVLTGGADRTIRLWNANLGTEIKTFAAHGYEVLSVCV